MNTLKEKDIVIVSKNELKLFSGKFNELFIKNGIIFVLFCCGANTGII